MGGIRAVAMATPGITLDFSFLDPAKIPARPPKKATTTSNSVGFVRANNSFEASEIGLIRKYKDEAKSPIPTATPRFFALLESSLKSLMPELSPIPIIGPMSGEINMAPITTAVELTFSPMEAMMMLKIKIHRVNPRNSTSFLMPSIVAVGSARSIIEKRSPKKLEAILLNWRQRPNNGLDDFERSS